MKNTVQIVSGSGANGVMKTWFLSFCDHDLPEGSQFLGACIVMGDGMPEALANARSLGCNPGGEVLGTDVEAEIVPFINAEWRRRLLTKEDIAVFDEELQRLCPNARERAKGHAREVT